MKEFIFGFFTITICLTPIIMLIEFLWAIGKIANGIDEIAKSIPKIEKSVCEIAKIETYRAVKQAYRDGYEAGKKEVLEGE